MTKAKCSKCHKAFKSLTGITNHLKFKHGIDSRADDF